MYQSINLSENGPTTFQDNSSSIGHYIKKDRNKIDDNQGNSVFNPVYISESYLPQNMENIPRVVNKLRPPEKFISSNPNFEKKHDSKNAMYLDFLNRPFMDFSENDMPTCGMGGCELYHREDPNEASEKIYPKNDLSECPLGIKNIYDSFSEYYKSLIFTKIKNVDNFSLYAANIKCNLGKGYRYIIITVPLDKTIEGFNTRISNLMWVSLQTRFIETNFNISPQYFNPPKINEFDTEIILEERTEKTTTYISVSLPMKLTLLNTNKGRDYANRANIRVALETYQTIITLNCG